MGTHQNLKTIFLLCFLWALGSVALPARTGAGGAPTTIFEALMRDGVLDMTIETDLTELIHNRRREDYQPAVLTYKKKDGTVVRQDIEVVPRGKFRRRICDFPPVRLKFAKKELRAAGLKTHNKVKLSTHCLDDKNAGNYNVFKEYLTYKFYNELTPNSFRVQLVRITYVDVLKQMRKIRRYGFLIEDDDELAERIGGKVCDTLNPSADAVSAFDETLMAVFEYMIGNEDWSMAMVRNMRLIERGEGTKVLPVPYDFDFSGVVNASYAVPISDLGQRHVKDRDYLGLETDPQVMGQVLDHFRERKAIIYHTLAQFKLLPATQRLEIKDYLETFYQLINTVPATSGKLPPWRYTPAQGNVSPLATGLSKGF